MAFQRDPETSRKAVAWLAVAFTLTVGSAVCSFIILAFAEDPRQSFTVLGGGLAAILFLIWVVNTPKDRTETRTWLQFWRKVHEPPDSAELYQPRRKRRAKSPLGSNQPPTIETVRELSERHARWVPHGPPPKRDRPER